MQSLLRSLRTYVNDSFKYALRRTREINVEVNAKFPRLLLFLLLRNDIINNSIIIHNSLFFFFLFCRK